MGLRIRGMMAGYGDLVVVRDIDLDVLPGETVGLIGLNGSGKSTVLGAIAGLTWSNYEELSLAGRNLGGLSIWQRNCCGLCLGIQRGGVFTEMSIGDNLRLAGLTPARLEDMFRDEHLRHVAQSVAAGLSRKARTLSGGEQRVLCVAMAIANARSTLLADEPSLGLAPEAAQAMLREVAELPKGRPDSGVLVVSHDYSLLAAVCDRLYALRSGRICGIWSKEELMDNAPSIGSALRLPQTEVRADD